MKPHFGVVIAGGGMAGATLACALARQAPSLSVLMVEATPLPQQPADAYQPSFDARATALAQSTQQIFEVLGLWATIARHATAIQHIHVSRKGHFGVTHLDAAEFGVAALGAVVDNLWLGHCLMDAVAQLPNVTVQCPARVERAVPAMQGYTLDVVAGEAISTVNTDLLVLADGGRSSLRDALGIATRARPYHQHAIIANLRHERPHQGVAYERFTDDGPLAMLPRGGAEGSESALVWTCGDADTDRRLSLSDSDFMAEIEARFGQRVGALTAVSERFAYPLTLIEALEQTRPGLAVVGNAAHTLHPVAGQGFNLAIRGLVALAEGVGRACRHGKSAGDGAMLADYAAKRQADQIGVVGFSDGVVRLFDHPGIFLDPLLAGGLIGLDAVGPLRRWFGRQAMGQGVPSARWPLQEETP